MSTIIRKMNRRNFLKSSTAAAGGLILGLYLPGRREAQAQSASSTTTKLNAFVQIGDDDTILLAIHKPDFGTGTTTSLPMLVAEELECDWKKIKTEFVNIVDPVYGVPYQGVYGSTAIVFSWEPLRKAGATAREMLLQAAANRWGVPRTQCRVENGMIVNVITNARVTFGSVAAAASKLEVPQQVQLKDASAFRLIGTSVPRLDTPDKVDGKTTYGIDVRLPGMLYASLERSPVPGGIVKNFDAKAALIVPGVKQVVKISNGIAVVAENTWAAMQGRKALNIEWDEGVNATASTANLRKQFSEIAETPGIELRKSGDPQAALANAAKTISVAYDGPYLAHAAMEPMNCTARVSADGCEVWAGMQLVNIGRDVAANAAGVPVEKVKMHILFMGGGFGRRGRHDFVGEAVEIAKAVGGGIPVKLTWTREDDFTNDGYRPMAHIRLAAGLDAEGQPTAFTVRVVSPLVLAPPPGAPPALLANMMFDWSGYDLPPNIHVDYHAPYRIPNVEHLLHKFYPEGAGIPIDMWRAPSGSVNTFFRESFIDELAVAAAKDPFEYRRRLLAKSPRLLAALELTAEKAGWGKPLPPGRFRGIAVDDSVRSYSAQVVEVSINKGKVRVHRVVTAVDCGQVINPKGVIQQIQSGIVFGLSAGLFGSITVDRGRIQQKNFNQYEVLRMDQMPEIEVHLIPSQNPPSGIGEHSNPQIIPAVANAIYAATAKRIRELPFRLAGFA